MKRTLLPALFTFLFLFPTVQHVFAQTQSQVFRLSEGFVRIAESGQLADTLSVWGDINAPGRYIVPRGTTVHELISYARGPIGSRTAGQYLDWSEVRLELSISRYDTETGQENIDTFTYKYNEPYPAQLRNYQLRSDDIVSFEVKRKPAFVDWLRVFSTVVSATATTIIVIDRLSN